MGRETNIDEYIKSITEGYGCDVYIEATGHPSSVEQGLQCIARKGVFVEYSVFGEKTTVDWTIISDSKELEIRGGHLGPYTYPTAIRMISEGLIPVEKIVTNKLPMHKFEEGFGLVNKSADSIKVVPTPDFS